MKSIIKYIPLFLFFLLKQTCFAQDIELHGTIFAADGEPVKFASLRLAKGDDGSLGADILCSSPILESTVNENGNFSIRIKKPGNYRLIITPINNEILVLPLYLQKSIDDITAIIHLAPINYLDSLKELKIVGNWDNFSNPENMIKQSDGSFVFKKELKTDTLSYFLLVNQIVTLPRLPEINCSTDGDNFKLDKYGDFISQVISNNRHFKVVFDPRKLKYDSKEVLPKVILDDQHKNLSKIVNLYLEWERMRIDISKIFWKKKIENNENFNYQGELSRLHQELEHVFVHEQSEPLVVRQFAIIFRLLIFLNHSDARVDSSLIPYILKYLPPNSPLWEFNPDCVMMLASSIKERNKSEELLRKFEEQNPNRIVRATALANLTNIAWSNNEKDKQRVLYNELKSKYGDVKEVALELQIAKPEVNSSLSAGHLLPKFSFKMLNKNGIITNNDLRGRYFLIDFWSTWCSGCVATIPYIDDVFQKYKNRNFTVLSVSFDSTPNIVDKFRSERYSMPWINAIVDSSNITKVCKDFNIISLPKAIFVNPQGKIIAVPSELMGENIVNTIDRIFSKRQ